jgi:hypothetical protein
LHLLVAVAVAAVLIVLATHWHRVRIRRAQVAAVRVALAGWLTYSSALPTSPEGGPATTGAVTSPGPAPVVVPHRVRFDVGGLDRHRMVA